MTMKRMQLDRLSQFLGLFDTHRSIMGGGGHHMVQRKDIDMYINEYTIDIETLLTFK
jgi:hypothetical protein